MAGSYADLWFPILITILIAFILGGGMIATSALLGHRVADTAKSTPYESGMMPVGNARGRFSVQFYLVAMVFILFDIEAIFLYPWATVYRKLGLFAFWEMLLFIGLVLGGFFYIYKQGVLDWAISRKQQEKREIERSERAA